MASIAKNYRKDHDEWVIGGKLTLLPGAVVDDQSKAGVVILPETVLTVGENTSMGFVTVALSATPVQGKTYTATYNGTPFDVSCEWSTEEQAYIFSEENAPFVFMQIPGGSEHPTYGMVYGYVTSLDGSTPSTLSIVEKAETASAGGGVCMVKVSFETEDGQTFTNVKKDKSYADLKAAYDADSLLWCRFTATVGGANRFTGEAPCSAFGPMDETIDGFMFNPYGSLGDMGVVICVNSDDSCVVKID